MPCFDISPWRVSARLCLTFKFTVTGQPLRSSLYPSLLVCTVITTKQSEQKIWENVSNIMEINVKARFALQNLRYRQLFRNASLVKLSTPVWWKRKTALTMEYECQHFSAFAWRVILGNSIYKSNCVVSVHNKNSRKKGLKYMGIYICWEFQVIVR